MSTVSESLLRFLVVDVVKILESSERRWVGDRSGSIRVVRAVDGWGEGALYLGSDDRLHVVLSVGPGEDVDQLPLEVRSIEARVELVIDPALGAKRAARMIVAAAGHLE